MTLDEAIEHSIEVAEENRINANSIESNMYIPLSVDKDNLVDGCLKCAEEHEQLAEWLEELKAFRNTHTEVEMKMYNKGRVDAIEEFADRVRKTDINTSNYPMNQVIFVKTQMLKEKK